MVGIVATALIISDGNRGTQGSGTSGSTTPSSTSTSSGKRSSTTPTTTTTTRTPQDDVLLAALPAVYKTGITCQPAHPGAGATAMVKCGKPNTPVDPRWQMPSEAEFRLFPDRNSQDAYFLALVTSRGIPRNDARGGCRPKEDPIHYALYYRDTSGPLPGEFTTCFLDDGTAQVWWVDSKTLTIGALKEPGNIDTLDQLDLWWNTSILSAS
ncbi:hypothetical protein BBK82_34285 [Lentzea guizhouensis]|uniref:Uncharacterized protein n=1 Tax=Lentzea guizhouensis TaxID=1586287 RepID=A0A1B2HRN9_9PSEU|nr:hypothetical protein [Lentzea guizhouensis]ANZ40345.1 hypothetical protein BBK82_34285 [Lentzea guizhouensis]